MRNKPPAPRLSAEDLDRLLDSQVHSTADLVAWLRQEAGTAD